MATRGRQPLEERIGIERFKQLIKENPDVSDISVLVCEHEITEEGKRHCEACRRAIYRAKERLESANKEDKTYQPIDDFSKIAEIQRFKEFMKAKDVQIDPHVQRLFRMWTWIRESGKAALVETQRPIMWKNEHVEYLRIKIDELQVSRYCWVQTLRAFFSSIERREMLAHNLLKARRRDMRSPKGAKREIDRFTIEEYLTEIRPLLREHEKLAVDLHITLKCREGDKGKGSLLDLKWTAINFQDSYYGFETPTATVYEPKTAGGTNWEHCPLNFWFSDLGKRLIILRQFEKSEYVVPFTYEEYRAIWEKISAALKKKFEPHDCRRSPSGWLRDLSLSDLAIGQYDARTGKATGFSGVGWENAEIFYQRYGKMNPSAIFDPEKRTLPREIDGLVLKALERTQKAAKS